jgi:hypothetical protein
LPATTRRSTRLRRRYGAEPVVEILLHPVHALIHLVETVIEHFDLTGELANLILEFAGALIERGYIGVLRLLMLRSRRGGSFVFVRWTEETGGLHRLRLRVVVAQLLRQRIHMRPVGRCQRVGGVSPCRDGAQREREHGRGQTQFVFRHCPCPFQRFAQRFAMSAQHLAEIEARRNRPSALAGAANTKGRPEAPLFDAFVRTA